MYFIHAAKKEMQSGSVEGWPHQKVQGDTDLGAVFRETPRGEGGCRTPHPFNPSFSQFRPQCIKSWNGEHAWALKPATFSTHSLYGLEQTN